MSRLAGCPSVFSLANSRGEIFHRHTYPRRVTLCRAFFRPRVPKSDDQPGRGSEGLYEEATDVFFVAARGGGRGWGAGRKQSGGGDGDGGFIGADLGAAGQPSRCERRVE